jgi:hypothetical protein
MARILLLLAALFSVRCEPFSPCLSLPVILPDVPYHWKVRFKDIAFKIRYPGCKETILEEGTLSPSTCLRARKLRYLPVIALPAADGIDLPPAGGLYPIDGSGPLCLSWSVGPLCELLLTLISRGLSLDGINIERLYREIGQREPVDPWKLDWQGITEGLLAGNFRVDLIGRREERTVSLARPEGIWFEASPFSPLYRVETGEPLEISLSLGLHRLFHLPSRLYVDIQVAERGAPSIFWGGVALEENPTAAFPRYGFPYRPSEDDPPWLRPQPRLVRQGTLPLICGRPPPLPRQTLRQRQRPHWLHRGG